MAVNDVPYDDYLRALVSDTSSLQVVRTLAKQLLEARNALVVCQENCDCKLLSRESIKCLVCIESARVLNGQ